MPLKFRGKTIFNPGGMQIGATGPRITDLLAGSVGGCYAAVSSSAAVAASFSVSGVTTSHKVYASVYSGNDSCNLVITRVIPGTDSITASLGNWVGTDISGAGSLVVQYLAILDK